MMDQKEYILSSFQGLLKWGYTEVHLSEYQIRGLDYNDCIINYLSLKNQKQIEIKSTNFDFFNLWIRRVINGAPAEYFDGNNNISLTELAVLYNCKSFNVHEYMSYNRESWLQLVTATTELFNKAEKELNSSEWFDIELLNKCKTRHSDSFNMSYANRFDFIDKVQGFIEKLLCPNHFKLTFQNKRYPPYCAIGVLGRIEFRNDKDIIEFRQADWRDYTDYYKLIRNGKEILVVSVKKDHETILDKIKNSLIKEGCC